MTGVEVGMVGKGENTGDGSTKSKPEIVAFTKAISTTRMDLEIVILSEVEDKYHLMTLTDRI